MKKFTQAGLGNKLDNEIRFMSKNNIDDAMQIVNILNQHHKRIVDWNNTYRNKYACTRWINDTRGCGYGCLVSEKRFTY